MIEKLLKAIEYVEFFSKAGAQIAKGLRVIVDGWPRWPGSDPVGDEAAK